MPRRALPWACTSLISPMHSEQPLYRNSPWRVSQTVQWQDKKSVSRALVHARDQAEAWRAMRIPNAKCSLADWHVHRVASMHAMTVTMLGGKEGGTSCRHGLAQSCRMMELCNQKREGIEGWAVRLAGATSCTDSWHEARGSKQGAMNCACPIS